jgi:hypothetical protein
LQDGEDTQAAAAVAGDAGSSDSEAVVRRDSMEGRRGMKARKTAAPRASAMPNQTRLKSRVMSLARTEKRAA